jgi:hypothetical protein
LISSAVVRVLFAMVDLSYNGTEDIRVKTESADEREARERREGRVIGGGVIGLEIAFFLAAAVFNFDPGKAFAHILSSSHSCF